MGKTTKSKYIRAKMIIYNIHPAFGQFIMVVLCVCLVFVVHLSSSDIIVICVQIRVRSYVIKYVFKYEKRVNH